jgi:hypothetical protein
MDLKIIQFNYKVDNNNNNNNALLFSSPYVLLINTKSGAIKMLNYYCVFLR